MKVVALAGGVGAAKFLSGLIKVVVQEDLTVVVNTGDDFRWMGLYVCPDLDTVTYTLAGLDNPETGWGVRGDTFRCLERLLVLQGESWFRIGDLDLASHLIRTDMLQKGRTLSEATSAISMRNRIRCRILPMSDSPVPTLVRTEEGVLEFQDYFVRRKCEPRVLGFTFKDADQSQPAPGVLEALASADAIIVCPSNPFISIGPILAVPGVRAAVSASQATVVAVSPVIAGRAIKGPTAAMLAQLGHDVSSAGVAAIYAELIDAFLLDTRDEHLRGRISNLGLTVHTAQTLMDTEKARVDLAQAAMGMVR
ncbi:MAG TPA: 2-phospho-L-lactate transferase [Acidobacteriota bacterium]|nr:2-phospho-L-lactate transferase [Acidobacteriota bacterium]